MSQSATYSKGRQTRSVGEGTTGENIAMMELNVDYRAVFAKLDTDGNGYITLGEFRTKLGTTNVAHQIPSAALEKIFRMADNNADGRLNSTEFIDLINSPDLPPTLRARMMGFSKRYVATVIPPRKGPLLGAVDEEGQDVPDINEYLDEYNCIPPPIFIILISLIELGVFIYYAFDMGYVNASGPVPMESPLIYNPHRRKEAWRYLTYMMIHAGFVHITFNLIIQLMLGIPLEMVHKWWRVGIIYFAGVIAGSLGTSISDPTVYLAGASAGCYAIITAHLSTIILNYKEMPFAIWQLLIFLVLIGVDVGVAVYNRYANAATDRTGYSAHLAGGVAGLLVGIGVLRNLKVQSWEKKLWWASVVTYGVLMLVAIIWNAAFPSYFPYSEI